MGEGKNQQNSTRPFSSIGLRINLGHITRYNPDLCTVCINVTSIVSSYELKTDGEKTFTSHDLSGIKFQLNISNKPTQNK